MVNIKSELIEKIREHYNDEELKNLCVHLNIRYEDLPGKGLSGKARELVEYCKRHNHLAELIQRCQKERPNVSWPTPPALVPHPSTEKPAPLPAPTIATPTKWYQTIPRWGWGVVIVVLVGAAALIFSLPGELTPTSTPETPEASLAVDSILTPTFTFTPIPPTITSTPTSTNITPPTIPPTPTVMSINAENVSQLTEVAHFGEGNIHDDVVYSPNGQLIAIPALGGVYLYNAATFAKEGIIATNEDKWVGDIAFSPSGDLVAFTIDNQLYLWDTVEQTYLPDPSTPETDHVHNLVFISDDVLAMGSHQEVYFWQPDNDELVNTVEAASEWVNDIAFTPDGSLMALGNENGIVEVWEVSECSQNSEVFCQPHNILTDLRHEVYVQEVDFSPNGRFLASASYDEENEGIGSLQIWDISTCYTQQEDVCATLAYHSGGDGIVDVLNLDFSSADTLVTSSLDDIVRLWEYDGQNWEATNQLSLDHYTGDVWQVLFSSDEDTLLASTALGSLFILHPKESTEPIQLNRAVYEHWDASTVALSQDGTTAVLGSWNDTIRILSLVEGQITQIFETETWVHAVAISPDGKTIGAILGGHDDIHLWFNDDFSQYIELNVPDYATAAVFSPNGDQIAVGADNGQWCLWSLNNLPPDTDCSLALVQSDETITSSIRSMAFSPDGKWIVTGHEDGKMGVWDAGNGHFQVNALLQGHSDEVNGVSFSPNGRWLASGSADNTVRLWQFNEGQVQTSDTMVLQEHTENVNSVAFSPDSSLLLSTSGDSNIRIWNVEDASSKFVLGNPGGVLFAAFSADGTFILSQGYGVVRIWGVEAE